MTKEINVLAHTPMVVRENDGIPYIMRPEFLLNFLSLSPQGAEGADPAVRKLLPSHVGLQIGQHLPSHHMHRLLGELDEWRELPDARREVRITEAANRLKFDRFKRYENNLQLHAHDEGDAIVAALRGNDLET